MNAQDAPIGTVVVIGHSANGRLAIKTVSGWARLSPAALIDDEEVDRGGNVVAGPSMRSVPS